MNNISVILASFNGEKYIAEQIESILSELESGDELIISDDGSTDNTINVAKSYKDDRIKIVSGPRTGFVNNFLNGFNYTKNEYIFFSDQDDIWLPGKRNIVLKNFDEKINLVKHDAYIVDENLNIIENSYNRLRHANVSFFRNIIANTFTGCCMALRRNWLEILIPIPDDIYHDWWIGLISCKYKCAKVIEDKLILYRRHKSNLSSMKPASLFKRIKKRIYVYRQVKKCTKIYKEII